MYRVVIANSQLRERYEVIRDWDHPEGPWDEVSIDELHEMYKKDLRLAQEEGYPMEEDFDTWLNHCLASGDCIRIK